MSCRFFSAWRTTNPGADEWRRQGGPLHVSEVADQNPLYDALIAAGEEIGLPNNPDYNECRPDWPV